LARKPSCSCDVPDKGVLDGVCNLSSYCFDPYTIVLTGEYLPEGAVVAQLVERIYPLPVTLGTPAREPCSNRFLPFTSTPVTLAPSV